MKDMEEKKSIDHIVYLKCASLKHLGYKVSKREANEFLELSCTKKLPTNDKSGELQKRFIEYLVKSKPSLSLDQDDKIRQTFLVFDARSQGFISCRDFVKVAKTYFPNLSQVNVEAAFRQIDGNGDGYVTYKEFDQLMKYLPDT